MNPDIFTTSAQELINKSIALAQEYSNPSLQPIHTLAAGLTSEFCASVFKSLAVNLKELSRLVEIELGKLPVVQGSQLTSDYSLENFFKECEQEAEKLGDSYVSLEHFILRWVESQYMPLAITTFFKHTGISRTTISKPYAYNP